MTLDVNTQTDSAIAVLGHNQQAAFHSNALPSPDAFLTPEERLNLVAELLAELSLR